MNIPKTNLQTFLKRGGSFAIACGLLAPVGLRAQSSSSSSSSYSSSYYAMNDPSPVNLQYNNQYGAPQYDNNQQYGNHRRPRYTGHSWTDHLVFEGGGGVTPPAGSTQNYANTGYNILLGAGVRFNHRLSAIAEWNFNRLGVPRTLAGVVAGTPGGNEHLWTVDVNPKFDFIGGERADGYVIGGGGFSRALVNYTVPVQVDCGYYYGYGGYGYGYGYGGGCTGDVTVAHTSSNQGNLDIGLGGEWRLSPYERGKIFLEARYERLFTPGGLPPGSNASYIPVTVGYRW